MKLNDIAVSLFEALQDRKPCSVDIQPIKEIKKDRQEYYLVIDGKRHKVSKKIAINAIKWDVPVNYLPTIYKLANVRFSIGE